MNHKLLSLDVILFPVVAGVYVLITPHPAVLVSVVVMAVGAYIATHIFVSAGNAFKIKLGLVWLLIAIAAVSPVLGGIILRHWTDPVLFVHDGVIQTEEAIKFLLAGKNPYVENYLNTPMALWSYDDTGTSINPGLYHLAYWPFLILFSLPFYLAGQATLGWFDERMLYLALLILLLTFIRRLASTREKQLALVLLVGLNPLFLSYFIEGRNDVFVLFWLVLSFVLLQSRNWVAALVTLAFACATKPTAWFILPFYTVYLLRGESPLQAFRRLLVPLGAFAAVMIAVILPFVLWDPNAFIDDVWNYTAGTAAFSYPIKTLGFGEIGLKLGWIPNTMNAFPFSLLQLIFGLPALFLLLRFQLKHNTKSIMWLCYGFLSLVIAFFSRVFNDNHFGFISSIFAIGLLIEEGTIEDQ